MGRGERPTGREPLQMASRPLLGAPTLKQPTAMQRMPPTRRTGVLHPAISQGPAGAPCQGPS
eukprot:11166026-Lingulodinium_polyedra.AAC.1